MTSKDVFENESQVLAEAKALAESSSSTELDFSNLVGAYGKLLKTTKRIIKLSDKNEQRLNILKEEAQETNKQLEGMSSQLSKFLSPSYINRSFLGAARVAELVDVKS